MTEIRFYHLTRRPLEAVLPKMLELSLARDGRRAVVMAGSAARVEVLNNHLWSYDDLGFLPHGAGGDGFEAQQPIWLTERDENPNRAEVLFLTDGASSAHVGEYALVCELFDGNDEDAVVAARARWRDHADNGYDVIYYQQSDSGAWEKKTNKLV